MEISELGNLDVEHNLNACKKQAHVSVSCHSAGKPQSGGKSKVGGPAWKIISRNRKGLKQKTREKGSESVQERQEPACLSPGCRRGKQPGRVSLRGRGAMVTQTT